MAARRRCGRVGGLTVRCRLASGRGAHASCSGGTPPLWTRRRPECPLPLVPQFRSVTGLRGLRDYVPPSPPSGRSAQPRAAQKPTVKAFYPPKAPNPSCPILAPSPESTPVKCFLAPPASDNNHCVHFHNLSTVFHPPRPILTAKSAKNYATRTPVDNSVDNLWITCG